MAIRLCSKEKRAVSVLSERTTRTWEELDRLYLHNGHYAATARRHDGVTADHMTTHLRRYLPPRKDVNRAKICLPVTMVIRRYVRKAAKLTPVILTLYRLPRGGVNIQPPACVVVTAAKTEWAGCTPHHCRRSNIIQR